MKISNLRESVIISIHDLRLGMFVVELDRPWTQTPFMLQGFKLNEQKDYDTLHLLVNDLVIDPKRSEPKSILHIPWDMLHEEQSETREIKDLPAIKMVPVAEQTHNAVYKHPVRRKIKKPTSNKVTEMMHFFLAAIFHAKKKQISSIDFDQTFQGKRARNAAPHYLRYSLPKNNEKVFNTSISQNQIRQKKLTPPSNAQFSAFIKDLYPRDAQFSPLSWHEKWRMWQEKRSKKIKVDRDRIVNSLKPKKNKPDYIPANIPLVNYTDQVPIEIEVKNAKIILEKAESILKKINSAFQDSGVLDIEQIDPTIQLLTESVIANPAALMWLMRMRTENALAVSHALKVAVYMMTMGRHIGFNRQQLVELGFIGLLLDVGKLEVPKEILQKPEKLTKEEKSIVQRHVKSSVTLLRTADVLNQNIEDGINEHHEKINGLGYPIGKRGDEISIFGKIAAIADSFAAMTSPSAYNVTRSSFDAMKELFKYSNIQFHAPLVEEFVQAIGIFPVGTMIELSNGVIAIVLEHNKIRRLEPKILLLTRADKTAVDQPQILDLMMQNLFVENKRISIARGLPDGAYGLSCQDYYKA